MKGVALARFDLICTLVLFTGFTEAARIKRKGDQLAGMFQAKDAPCCCKEGSCTSKNRVYQPDLHLCCKIRAKGCYGAYGTPGARDSSFCRGRVAAPESPQWAPPPVEPVKVENLTKGSHAHTLHHHCKHDGSGEGEDADDETTNRIVSMFAKELKNNSVLATTRELFTMYTCMRWAPDVSYWPLAEDELESGQLPRDAEAAEGDALLLTARAAERGHFIPLKCSANIGVYDEEQYGEDGRPQHFRAFERRLLAMSEFFAKENNGFFDSRARKVEAPKPWEFFWTKNETKRERWNALLSEALLFNSKALSKKLKECPPQNGISNLEHDVRGAAGGDLMEDCAFLRWWAPKLRMITKRFPFEGFLAGSRGASLKPGNRVLICFGKRVAGELHRRKEGSHILTDMNGVGCHGFWDFQKAQKMLQQIAELWAPPTCQLTELELTMKTRMLAMFAEMNKKLFESLPALIASESFDDAHPSAREATGAHALLAGGKWVVNKMSAMFNTYKSLGDLMTNSVMKWPVCAIAKEEGLDRVLGSDDLLAQKYTQKAYQQWTGSVAELPGESCVDRGDVWVTVSGSPAQVCSIGKVLENYPEPYKDVNFACPRLPVLPAAQQLNILKNKHTQRCLVMASSEELGADSWEYKGNRPTEVQYPANEHSTTAQMEMVVVLDVRSSLDEFSIQRDFVTLGRVCTLEVANHYPRWCQKPELVNTASILSTLGDGMASAAHGIISTAQGLTTGGSTNDKDGWKSWAQRQFLGIGNGISNSFRSVAKSVSQLGGASQRRYQRITGDRLYESIDAGESLWSMTFQKGEGGGGERQQFDRYVTTVPCDGIDVKEEISSEFSWGQVALELLDLATRHGTPQEHDAFLGSPTLYFSVRTEVELHMATHMPQRRHVAWRVGKQSHGGIVSKWMGTDRHLTHLESLFSMGAAQTLTTSMPAVYGGELALKCGRRADIYNGAAQDSFIACLNQGVAQAEQRAKRDGKEESSIERAYEVVNEARSQLEALRREFASLADTSNSDGLQAEIDKQASLVQVKEVALADLLRQKPQTLQEYNEEIVVRADFASLSQCEFFGGTLDEVIASGSAEDASYEAKKNKEAAQAMKRQFTSCQAVGSPTPFPGDARRAVVGAYKGNNLPANARAEVILSPLDVKAWVSGSKGYKFTK